MKRVLFLACALLAGTVSAQNIKVGGDLLGGLTMPTLGSDLEGDAGIGWSVHAAPMAEFSFNEKFAIDGSVGFGMSALSVDDETMTPMWLELGLAPVYKLNEQAFLSLGYVWSMPVGGSTDDDADVVWAGDKLEEGKVSILSNHSIVLGGGYSLTPELSLIGGIRYGVLGLFPKADWETGKIDGRADSKIQTNLHELNIGVRYAIGL